MDKRKLIFTSLIVLALVVATLSITYALNVNVTQNTTSDYDLSYTFDISDNATWTINLEAGKTKIYEISITNPYSDSIKYGIVYKMDNPTTMPDNSLVGIVSTSENFSQGSINSNSTINVSIAVVNSSTSNMQVTLSVISGYKNGGELIIPDGYTLITDEYDIVTNEPNSPDLVQGLIPVMYDGSKWVKADSSNSNETYKWYDYNNKLWANAVLVTSTNRSTYQSANPGTTISTSDILAFYVWIPRYKYKVWNINKVIGTDSYDAYNTGIDIVFESEKASTGTISCTYSYAEPSSDANSPNETCTGSNGDYYTHPAFTFGSDELRGFWIGKFELTGDSSKLTILPNVSSLIAKTVSSFSTMIQNMQTSNNIYGLNTSRINTDSHLLTNYEWGAVAYLTNSKYGRCTNGSCTEVTKNNCSSHITGIGADSVSASESSSTCTTAANKYNGAKGVLASTTGNITGVYDMSGGAWETTMGNMSSTSGSYTFCPANSEFSSNWYTTSTAKYVTTYAYVSSYTISKNQTAYNKGRLGDATGEIVLSSGSGWYSDMASFMYSGSGSWSGRGGGYYNDSNSGIFSLAGDQGVPAAAVGSSRAALVSLSA